MTTKILTGAYPNGYSLSAAYTGLIIENSASVGGYGVSASFEAEIQNYGVVSATQGAGISLTGGGSVINGSSKDTTALIYGHRGDGVYIGGTSATVDNNGTIAGISGIGLYGHGTATVTNGSATDTAALIEGGFGMFAPYVYATVANYGTIWGGFFSIQLQRGGTVTNGSNTDTTALLKGYVEAWSSTIVNFGTIEARPQYIDDGVFLDGGSVINGSTTDTAALINGDDNGVRCYGARASLVNFWNDRGRYLRVIPERRALICRRYGD